AQPLVFVQQTQEPVGGSPIALVASDFNGDGITDLAVADRGTAAVSILLGAGKGFFLPAMNITLGVGPSAIAAADFNRDGIQDLAIANSTSNTVTLLLGNGNGTFRTGTEVTAFGPSALAVADFN